MFVLHTDLIHMVLQSLNSAESPIQRSSDALIQHSSRCDMQPLPLLCEIGVC